MRDGRPVPGPLYRPVVPIIVVAHDGMDAQRRFEAGQHSRPFARRNDARDLVQAGDIVAEQHDDVSIQRVGAVDDGLDPVQRHPGSQAWMSAMTAIFSGRSAGHCRGVG